MILSFIWPLICISLRHLNVLSSCYITDRLEVCDSDCDVVSKLKKEVSELTERVRILSTALRLYSFAGSGPPGPEGPAGPIGPQGPRGK